MIVLLIIFSLLVIISLILLIDISFVFTYKEKFDFRVKILCFSLDGDKIIELAEGRGDNKELNDKKAQAQSLNSKKKSPLDIIELLSYIVELVKAITQEFTRYVRLKLCRLKVSLGTDDPANTAMLYGTLSSALYAVIEYFNSFVNLKRSYKNIGIIPNFTSDECEVDFKLVLKIKIVHLLFAFIHISPVLSGLKKGK